MNDSVAKLGQTKRSIRYAKRKTRCVLYLEVQSSLHCQEMAQPCSLTIRERLKTKNSLARATLREGSRANSPEHSDPSKYQKNQQNTFWLSTKKKNKSQRSDFQESPVSKTRLFTPTSYRRPTWQISQTPRGPFIQQRIKLTQVQNGKHKKDDLAARNRKKKEKMLLADARCLPQTYSKHVLEQQK